MNSGVPSTVHLDIGGKKFSTTVDTLTQREPNSMLAAMFSGRHTVHLDSGKGCVFVDRDGKHFRHILNWLRDGAIPILSESEYQELLREAEYYQLLGMVAQINEASKKDDSNDNSKAELTRTDVIKYIQSKKVKFRGVNLSGLDLSYLDVNAEGSVFYNAILRERCEFISAKLHEAVLDKANLQSANLQDAQLTNCSFREANLRSAHLQTVDLSGANLEGANLEGANLKGAKLIGANLQCANLQRAYLCQVDLRDTQLDGAKLDGANMHGVTR